MIVKKGWMNRLELSERGQQRRREIKQQLKREGGSG